MKTDGFDFLRDTESDFRSIIVLAKFIGSVSRAVVSVIGNRARGFASRRCHRESGRFSEPVRRRSSRGSERRYVLGGIHLFAEHTQIVFDVDRARNEECIFSFFAMELLADQLV